jgi:hypothetical protein
MGGRRVPFVRRDLPLPVRRLAPSAHRHVTPETTADIAPTAVRVTAVTGATDVASTAVPIISSGKRTPGLRGRER